MSGLLCCFSRQRAPRPGEGYRVLSGRRGLAVSYNQAISSTQCVAIGNAYEAPLVTPSGKPPCFEDFILHKTIGRGSFGRVSWHAPLRVCAREIEHGPSICTRAPALEMAGIRYYFRFLYDIVLVSTIYCIVTINARVICG